MRLRKFGVWVLFLIANIIAIFATLRLRFSGDLTELFPRDSTSQSLKSYLQSFQNAETLIAWVQSPNVDQNKRVAEEIAKQLQNKPHIRYATTTVPTKPGSIQKILDSKDFDPTLVWAFADSNRQRILASAFDEPTLRARLEESRALLLAPGSGSLKQEIQNDPLRLRQLLASTRNASSHSDMPSTLFYADMDGNFTLKNSNDRWVWIVTEGISLRSHEAHRVVKSVESIIHNVQSKFPATTIKLIGAPVIARDTEQLIRNDLWFSSLLSVACVTLVFWFTFRRGYALLAIGPPLVFGTLWVTAIASMIFGQLTAVAMGFASVVIGVGLDTGVHVYAAVIRIRRETGAAASNAVIAMQARREVAWPTLCAACAAACAFGSLALSQIHSLRQFGLLCALGEILTAIAIVWVTPILATWIESKPKPQNISKYAMRFWQWTLHQRAFHFVFIGILASLLTLIFVGLPNVSEAIVAIKPTGVSSLQAQEEFERRLSNDTQPMSHVIVLQKSQSQENEEALLERNSIMIMNLKKDLPFALSIESITHWVFSRQELEARFRNRDQLNLPERISLIKRIMQEIGFDPEAFASFFNHLQTPGTVQEIHSQLAQLRSNSFQQFKNRYMAFDSQTKQPIIATYVRLPAQHISTLERKIATLDANAIVTGYPLLERALRQTLYHDVPRIAGVSIFLVLIALQSVFRSWRKVCIVSITLLIELIFVLLGARLFSIPIHIFSVLTLPVLIGITIDESIFILHAFERYLHTKDSNAFLEEIRSVITTACTTAAGFAALLICRFPGLRDLGAMGCLGSLAGLLTSLAVVPVLAQLMFRSVARDFMSLKKF